MDNITVHIFIINENKFITALSFLVIGAWTGVIVGFGLTHVAGRLVDPEFRGITVSNSVMHWRAAIAGLLGAVSTMFFLWGNQYGDPSAMIALANSTLIYTAIWEVATKQLSLRRIVWPLLLVFLGSSLAAYTGSVSVTLAGVVLVAILSNGFGAAGELVEQKGVQHSDGVNMYLWRFLWLAVGGTLLALAGSFVVGELPLLVTMIDIALRAVWWISILMIFVFFGLGFKLTLKRDNSVSVVLLATTFQVLISYPITFIGDILWPGAFGALPSDPQIWLIRCIGAAFLLIGLGQLRKLEFQLKLRKEV